MDTSKDDKIKQTDVKAILKKSAKELRTMKFITDHLIEKDNKQSKALKITTQQ